MEPCSDSINPSILDLVIAPAFINYTILVDYRTLIETCLEDVVGRRVSVNILEQKDLPEIISEAEEPDEELMQNEEKVLNKL